MEQFVFWLDTTGLLMEAATARERFLNFQQRKKCVPTTLVVGAEDSSDRAEA